MNNIFNGTSYDIVAYMGIDDSDFRETLKQSEAAAKAAGEVIQESLEMALDMKFFHEVISELREITRLASGIQVDMNISEAMHDLQKLRREIERLDSVYIPLVADTYVDTFHSGGIVKAHSGLLARDEVPAILKKDEMVIQPLTTQQFTTPSWYAFNATGNPGALQPVHGDHNARPVVNISVIHPAPETRVQVDEREYIDNHIYPRILVNETHWKQTVFR